MKMSMDEKAGRITETYLEIIENDDVDLAALQMLAQFFDIDSRKNMDLKLEVLRKVADGYSIDEIDGFYDILELYPGDDTKW